MRQSGGLGEEMAGAGAALALKRPRVERHVCARGRRGAFVATEGLGSCPGKGSGVY